MFGPTKAQRDAEFTEFAEGARASLMRTGWLLTGNGDAAQELVQAALVKTYAAWPRIRHGQSLAYARRCLINHRTDVWRATRHELSAADPPEPRPRAQGADPVSTDTVDDRDAVVRMLQTLPDQQRKIIVLRYYTDLSEPAVADLLGISIGTVKSAASRGLVTLRTRYAATEGGTP